MVEATFGVNAGPNIGCAGQAPGFLFHEQLDAASYEAEARTSQGPSRAPIQQDGVWTGGKVALPGGGGPDFPLSAG